MKRVISVLLFLCLLLGLAGCGTTPEADSSLQETSGSQQEEREESTMEENQTSPYTVDTPISDVMNDPVFGEYGRLIFPVDSGYYS